MNIDVVNQYSFLASFGAQDYGGDSGGVDKQMVNGIVDEATEAFMSEMSI